MNNQNSGPVKVIDIRLLRTGKSLGHFLSCAEPIPTDQQQQKRSEQTKVKDSILMTNKDSKRHTTMHKTDKNRQIPRLTKQQPAQEVSRSRQVCRRPVER